MRRFAALGATLILWVPVVAAARASDGIGLQPCHVAGIEEFVKCGRVEVFENREAAVGRRIPIAVTVLPAVQRNRRPDPLVLLAGGPGQGARSYARWANRVFSEVRRTRDIVLIDVRGTGESRPLRCASLVGAFDAPLAGGTGFDVADCLAHLDADPRWYANETIAGDLDEVLSALGYGRVNLWGGSFGTRTALVFCRQFPLRVRTVILDSAVPFELAFPLHVPVDSQRALDRLLADCDSDAACRAAYPDLSARLTRLLADLDREPRRVTFAHPDRGSPVSLKVDPSFVSQAIRGALYLPNESSLLPFAVFRAVEGDYGPLAALVARVSESSVQTMSLAATLSVLCTEDVHRLPDLAVPAGTRESFLGESMIEEWLSLCRNWPAGPRPKTGPDRPMSVPALIFSGDLDPVTPPRWGEQMAREFSPATHLIMAGMSHNSSVSGCGPALMARFIEDSSARSLDLTCTKRRARPPFVLDFSGPQP